MDPLCFSLVLTHNNCIILYNIIIYLYPAHPAASATADAPPTTPHQWGDGLQRSGHTHTHGWLCTTSGCGQRKSRCQSHQRADSAEHGNRWNNWSIIGASQKPWEALGEHHQEQVYLSSGPLGRSWTDACGRSGSDGKYRGDCIHVRDPRWSPGRWQPHSSQSTSQLRHQQRFRWVDM